MNTKFDKCIILNLSSHVKKTIYTVGVTDNITAIFSSRHCKNFKPIN